MQKVCTTRCFDFQLATDQPVIEKGVGNRPAGDRMVLAWDKLGLLLDEPVLGAELQNFPRTQLDKEKSVRVIGAISFHFTLMSVLHVSVAVMLFETF